MSQVENITQRFELLFKRCYGLNNSQYEKVMMNVELLKKKYFNSKFRKKDKKLFEHKTFKELILSL